MQFISEVETHCISSFLLQITSISSFVLHVLICESISLHCIYFSGDCIFIFWILDTLFTTVCSPETFAVQDFFFPSPLSIQNAMVEITDKGSEWQTPVGQPVITIHLGLILLLFSILSAHSVIIISYFSGGQQSIQLQMDSLILG